MTTDEKKPWRVLPADVDLRQPTARKRETKAQPVVEVLAIDERYVGLFVNGHEIDRRLLSWGVQDPGVTGEKYLEDAARRLRVALGGAAK